MGPDFHRGDGFSFSGESALDLLDVDALLVVRMNEHHYVQETYGCRFAEAACRRVPPLMHINPPLMPSMHSFAMKGLDIKVRFTVDAAGKGRGLVVS